VHFAPVSRVNTDTDAGFLYVCLTVLRGNVTPSFNNRYVISKMVDTRLTLYVFSLCSLTVKNGDDNKSQSKEATLDNLNEKDEP